jgi:hypothetical protein
MGRLLSSLFALAATATVTLKIRMIVDGELALPDFLCGHRWGDDDGNGQLICSYC